MMPQPNRILKVSPSKLILEDNLRTADLKVQQMVEDLISVGYQLQPIGVRQEKLGYRVVYGHRRAAALQLIAKKKLVPDYSPLRSAVVMLLPANVDAEHAQIAENSARLDYTPIEIAQIAKRLQDRGVPMKRIAEMFGRSPAWISQHLGLLRLPEQVQKLVGNQITAYEGYLLSQLREQQAIERAEALLRERKLESAVGAITTEAPAPEPKAKANSHSDSHPRVGGHFSRTRVITELGAIVRKLPSDNEVSSVVRLVMRLLRGEKSVQDFISDLRELVL